MSFADPRAALIGNARRAACLAAALGLAAALATGSASAGAAPPLEGSFAGDFSLLDPPVPAPLEVFEDLAGAPVRLADFKGRVVLLNFWATWCAPCIREMPALDRLQARLGAAGLTVAAVSLDRGGREVVAPFARKLGLENLALYLDPKQRLSRAFRVAGLPMTFLIDRRGGVVGVMAGAAEWDSPEAHALIQHYLDEAPEAG